MNKSVFFVFIAASFALIVPAPGRLAYGIVLILELDFVLLLSAAFRSAIRGLDLGNLQDAATLAFIAALAIFFRQIVILLSPVIAFNLSLVMHIPPISAYLLGSVFSEKNSSGERLFPQAAVFSAFAFLFFLMRDILGYGTITFPVHNGIAEAVLFDSYSTSFLSFFASIPGSLLLTVIFMAALLCVQYKMNILEKAEVRNAGE